MMVEVVMVVLIVMVVVVMMMMMVMVMVMVLVMMKVMLAFEISPKEFLSPHTTNASACTDSNSSFCFTSCCQSI